LLVWRFPLAIDAIVTKAESLVKRFFTIEEERKVTKSRKSLTLQLQKPVKNHRFEPPSVAGVA